MSEQRIKQRSVLALGMFDGVHVGHQALLFQAAQAAKALDAQTVAFTFTDAPGKLLHLPVTSLSTPEQRTRWLRFLQRKEDILYRVGCDLCVVDTRIFGILSDDHVV